MENKTLFVTGGLGFIGAHFIAQFTPKYPNTKWVILDKMTYAADITRLEGILDNENVILDKIDLAEKEKVQRLFSHYAPDGVINFAAESHVDNSIATPLLFLESNVRGTINLLEAARELWLTAAHQIKANYKHARFYQISTDEVFGSLGKTGKFSETSPYAPNSPYSASKAAADHWVRSYHHTYGLPTLISQCSNNFGPFQHQEKLIPTIIRTALQHQPIPIYGDGKNVRDWLYVEDHCNAINCIFREAQPGETYTIGGNNEITNHQLCLSITDLLDQIAPREDGRPYQEQIHFVDDRPGHDFRYAISTEKIEKNLSWKPIFIFESALKKTVQHYIEQQLKTNRSL